MQMPHLFLLMVPVFKDKSEDESSSEEENDEAETSSTSKTNMESKAADEVSEQLEKLNVASKDHAETDKSESEPVKE